MIIVQARMGSTRLPGKVLLPLGDTTVIGFMLRRIHLEELTVTIPNGSSDNPLADQLTNEYGYCVCRGSENDVLARFYDAAGDDGMIVRLTADCPFVDPDLVSKGIDLFDGGGYDYLSTSHPERRVTRGFDVEIFSREALVRAHFECGDAQHREHVTQHFYDCSAAWPGPPNGICRSSRYRCGQFGDGPVIDVNLSIDTREDYDRACQIAAKIDPLASMAEILEAARG